MATLLGINYESSEDEEVASPPKAQEQVSITVAPSQQVPALAPPELPPSARIDLPITGPTQGPIAPHSAEADLDDDDVAPGSPFTTSRSRIRNLTLPTVPNWDIPASPPGSPPLRATKKFTQFLELKKNKGQHFNQRLENSSVLRDPGHMARLMDFAGVLEEEQYASTLPAGLAVPTAFPEWAYVEELRASQKKMMVKVRGVDRAKHPREAIDFVPATKSGASSRTGTPSARGAPPSAAERVMEGLTRQKPSAALLQGGPGKRKELEQRGGRSDYPPNGRSPKRRRSRSR
ncbi:hypothetical protein K504DRAFT_431116 [Pleomassaria siparia CBS 279.74]|uniref:HCNGP-domain-containing protein n=1 Tax=Pleomassaria siparia CBS 279.74 TaxID=1314801 RepID=A0A6G1KCF6_9PLEO|nr:hypothetical protein K504DRAFT_431116 [Pleomassaria siparia CBS 279.74]